MPEYRSPGIYVEEGPFRGREIEGVDTSTAGFAGPCRYGPVHQIPEVITSLAEFERIYGDGRQLEFEGAAPEYNFVWHAARAFFAEGGRRLYVARVFQSGSGGDGHARASAGGGNVLLVARYPGSAGNVPVRFTFSLEPGGSVPVAAWSIPDDRAVDVSLSTTAPASLSLAEALLADRPGIRAALERPGSTEAARSFEVQLTGGNDGARPLVSGYQGSEDGLTGSVTGLAAFEKIEDLSVIAAPGGSQYMTGAGAAGAASVLQLLVSHAERMRHRIALLDAGEETSVDDVRALRSRFDSSRCALYYPWVQVLDPVTNQPIHLPPSGFIAGIYARSDLTRGVWKVPANLAIGLASGLQTTLNKAQQDLLNSEGINCLRHIADRGFLVWGARTLSSDPEWKYVNVRRYLAYLEHSIEKGTQWTVFAPNGEALWTEVRAAVENFLLREWRSGALLGVKSEEAFFVRCDRTTMTQNDLDNGRLICLIGVAVTRPAEFVIFRIGQWTAGQRA